MTLTKASLSTVRQRIDRLVVQPSGASTPAPSGENGPYGRETSQAGYHAADQEAARRHYLALRDTVFTAVRPIANRFAEQPLKIATVPIRQGSRSTNRNLQEAMVKELRDRGYLGSSWRDRQVEARNKMPTRVKNTLPPDAVVVDSHDFLEAICRPNNFMTSFATLYSMAASLMTVGKALLLWDEIHTTPGRAGGNTPSAYYIPMHWAQPLPGVPAMLGWDVQPPGGESIPVTQGQFIYTALPDPGNPFGALSPMGASKRPINTQDKIADAHQASMDNLINPSYAVVAGQVMSAAGRTRARLTKTQRRDITNAIKNYIGGAFRSGEPIILDALIEDIKDISPKNDDLGFKAGGQMTEDKIMKAYGVSPIITGWVQNANRAGSVVSQDLFFDVVLNPLLTLSGEAFTHALGPQYSTEEYRVVIYHERARAEDKESLQKRAQLFVEAFSAEEKRRYIRTGEIEWVDADAPPGAEYSQNNPASANVGEPPESEDGDSRPDEETES